MSKPKLFISWSGDRGRAVADAFAKWARAFIQGYEPFVSIGIESGADWWTTIRTELETAAHAVVVVTPESKDSRWLNFEVGALSTKLERRVCPYLVGVEPSDLESPLALFQARTATRDETRKLLSDLDGSLSAPLGPPALDSVFDASWPALERDLEAAKKALPSSLPVGDGRSIDDKIDEILSITRRMDRDGIGVLVNLLSLYERGKRRDYSRDPFFISPKLYNDTWHSSLLRRVFDDVSEVGSKPPDQGDARGDASQDSDEK